MSELTTTQKAWIQPFQIKENLSMRPIDVKRLLGLEHVEVQEAVLFLNKCKQYGADPFMNDMYMIKYSATAKPSIVTGIGFFQKKASENPRFEGYSKTHWLTKAGKWVDCWIPSIHGKNPMACQASCWIKGYKEKQTFSVNWEENSKNTGVWNSMPSRMLEKNAMVGLLRACLPADLGGLYISEEITGEEMPTATVAPASVKLETVSEDLRDPEGGKVFGETELDHENRTMVDRENFDNRRIGVEEVLGNGEPTGRIIESGISRERQEIDASIKKKAEAKKAEDFTFRQQFGSESNEQYEEYKQAVRSHLVHQAVEAKKQGTEDFKHIDKQLDDLNNEPAAPERSEATEEMPRFGDYEQDSRPNDETDVDEIPI